LDATLSRFVKLCSNYLPDDLRSILYYPHPFTDGGLVVILAENSAHFLEASRAVYAGAPHGYSMHLLRSHELDMLAAPGMFVPPLHVNEMPHLPYYLKHKGECLYGQDYREQIPLPDRQYLLESHIEGCYDYLRRYGILSMAINQEFEKLVLLLDREILLLMATAVLAQKGHWEVNKSSLAGLFFTYFTAPGLAEAYKKFKADATEPLAKVWYFESFLRELRKLA
jgi:hypothetical protein